MKTITILLVGVFLCASLNLLFSQSSKTCNSSSQEVLLDLNSITKCTIEKSTDASSKNKSELKISYRKVRRRIKTIKDKKVAHSINTTQNDVTKSVVVNEINPLNIKKTVATEEILFSVADQIPLFPKCSLKKEINQRSCFNNQIAKHFTKNFYPERVTDESIKGRVFIQFTIDFKGNVQNILVKSGKKSSLLNNEIKRVVNKLPKMTPGIHKGLPVNVRYSIPINIDVN